MQVCDRAEHRRNQYVGSSRRRSRSWARRASLARLRTDSVGAVEVTDRPVRWREAMARRALRRRTASSSAATACPAPAPLPDQRARLARCSPRAVLRLVTAVDEALGRPDPLDVVDVGAGARRAAAPLAVLAPTVPAPAGCACARSRCAPRPADLPGAHRLAARPARARLGRRRAAGHRMAGQRAARHGRGRPAGRAALRAGRPATAPRRSGGRSTAADARVARTAGGRPRTPRRAGRARAARATRPGRRRSAPCSARAWRWRSTTGTCATPGRPAGTLTGFRAGRRSPRCRTARCDVTAHVAMDARARPAGGRRPARRADHPAARRCGRSGLDGARPPLEPGHRPTRPATCGRCPRPSRRPS